MFRITCWLISILFIVSCTSVPKAADCETFKEGKFKVQSALDDTYWLIERHDSVQEEVNAKTGDTAIMNIKWTGQCAYELTRRDKKGIGKDSLSQKAATIPLKVRILNSTNEYCVFEAHKEGIDMVYKDTLWKLRK